MTGHEGRRDVILPDRWTAGSKLTRRKIPLADQKNGRDAHTTQLDFIGFLRVAMSGLLSPLQIGSYVVPNRVFMAPLTRCRAGARNVPHRLNALYYRQRASAGLIVSEATQISPSGAGYPNTPGIYTPEQVRGWRLVTDAVHARGGRIFAQLWHVGRVSHPAYQPDGLPPVSASAIGKRGAAQLPDGSSAPSVTPRALSVEEIRQVMGDYRHAAQCALEAGFDGVELHGANGYLPDQFLRDGTNQRTDEYGGTVENRARFHLEATRQLMGVWGRERVGVRLSPSGTFNDMRDSNPRATFGYLVREFDKLGIAYVHILEAMDGDLRHGPKVVPGYDPIPVSYFRPLFKNAIIVNSMYDFRKGTAVVESGAADAVAFGVLFIANPDLPERFAQFGADVPLNQPDPATFYGGGEKGYTDYPALAASRQR